MSMRDKGGSDLDVFNSLTKGGGARGQSVGVPAQGSDTHGGAPPPPPSLRETHYEDALNHAEEVSVEDELDETDLDAPQLEVGEIDDIGKPPINYAPRAPGPSGRPTLSGIAGY